MHSAHYIHTSIHIRQGESTVVSTKRNHGQLSSMFSQRVLGTGTIAVGNRCMSIFVHVCCIDRKSHFCLIIPTGAFLHTV